jgi:hypothetical protein
MEGAHVYRHSVRYTASAWLLVAGRAGVLATVAVLASLLLMKDGDGRVSPPDWWIVTFGIVVVGTIAAIWAGLGLALGMRCDACGRRPTIVWHTRQVQPDAPGELAALRDHFFPPELRSREFRCAQCGAHFKLQGRG